MVVMLSAMVLWPTMVEDPTRLGPAMVLIMKVLCIDRGGSKTKGCGGLVGMPALMAGHARVVERSGIIVDV
jgi:hypothetical protein